MVKLAGKVADARRKPLFPEVWVFTDKRFVLAQ